jgi:hypothetical protein
MLLVLVLLNRSNGTEAVEAFEAVRYSRAKGALGYWNDIIQAAERMINPPDEGTMKCKFLNSLPHDMVEVTLKSRPINIELAMPNELIEAIQQMEATLHYISSHRRAKGESNLHPSPSRTAPQVLSGP